MNTYSDEIQSSKAPACELCGGPSDVLDENFGPVCLPCLPAIERRHAEAEAAQTREAQS